MIIETISLSNWLSYPDKWEMNGQVRHPSFRFDDKPVCLVFGRNGAGKSSIMDAIIFALFGGYSRSTGTIGPKQGDAVRAGETSATVELVFRLNEQRYKVKRIQPAKGSAKATFFSWNASEHQWQRELSQIKAIDSKTSSLLGMNQDLFCGTVMLEQGKASRFMELKSKDQVAHVTKLLGLDVYTAYYEKTKSLANQRKQSLKKIEKKLSALSDASAEKVAQAKREEKKRHDTIQQCDSEIQRLNQLLEQTRAIEGLQEQITKVTNQIQKGEEKLKEADKIRAAHQIVNQWAHLEPILREVEQAVRQHQVSQQRVDTLEKKLENIRTELAGYLNEIEALAPQHKQAEEALKQAEDKLNSLRAESTKAQAQHKLIASELEFDHQERDLQAQQSKRQTKLEKLTQVKADYDLRTELRGIVRPLKAIVASLNSAEQMEASAIADELNLTVQELALTHCREQLTQLIKQKTNSNSEAAMAQSTVTRISSELKATKKLLKKRQQAHGQSTCPTCGTALEGKELDRFHQNLLKLEQEVAQGQIDLMLARQKAEALHHNFKENKRQCRKKEDKIAREESRLATEKEHIEWRKAEASKQEEDAQNRWDALKTSLNYSGSFIVAPTQKCIDLAYKQLIAINDVYKIYDELIQVQADFKAANTELDRLKQKRQHPVGTFSEEEFAEVAETVSKLDDETKQTEASLKKTNQMERDISSKLNNAQNSAHHLKPQIQKIEEEELPKEKYSLKDSKTYKQRVCTRLKELLAKLDWPTEQLEKLWQVTFGDEDAKLTVGRWVDEYRPLAKQLSALKKAEQEINNLRAKCKTLREQIRTYPSQARQAKSPVVEQQLQEQKTEKENLETLHKKAQKAAWDEGRRWEEKQKLENNRKRLVDEERAFRDLKKLLAPPSHGSLGGPLLQHIIRGALQEVAMGASTILDDWGQSTEVLVPKETLTFKVMDRASGNSERYYQLFSGGEKFMVALAMALAIGEVASPTGHTDCLFIDEGFGLLDADNRGRVAQEIVSNLIRSGRRKQVIVITHMEDLQSAFSDYYHLVNDGSTTQLFLEDPSIF